MPEKFNNQVAVLAVDSMHLEICKRAGEKKNKMGKESVFHSHDKSYCVLQKKYFCGCKLYCVCSEAGVQEFGIFQRLLTPVGKA